MSSILKALKKLEEEKSLSQEENKINISREILKQNSGNKNVIKWLWLLGSSTTLVIIVLTAALMRKSSTKEAVRSGELPIVSQPTLPATPVQPLTPSPELSGKSKKNDHTPTSSVNNPELKPYKPPQELTPDNLINNGKATQPNISIPGVKPPITEQDVKAVPLRPAASSVPTLSLSGIAWNKDSSDRLAIINGQPTATGANINGVIVEEILQDRVRLSYNGRFFELFIGRNARTD